MRETALKNAGDSVLPEVNGEYPPPPPPIDEDDFGELSIDLSEAIDPRDALDESGIERTPMADPGIVDEPGSPLGLGAHIRRRSMLPGKIKDFYHDRKPLTDLPIIVDPTVLYDLQAHRSLDDRTAPTLEG